MTKYILILLLILLTSCKDGVKENQPKAKNGSIDISSWDFEKNGDVKLKGDWEFYWKRLYFPKDFKKGVSSDELSYYQHPGLWKSKKDGPSKISKYGYATYRLKVKLPESKTPYGIKLVYSLSNHVLYIDGEKVVFDGTVGTSKDTSKTSNISKFHYFTPENDEIELIMQLSNFSMEKGGSHRALIIGKKESISAFERNSTILNTFMIGSTFIMAIYHLVLYAIRRKDAAPFFFGLFCLVTSIRSGFTGNAEIFYSIFPEISWIAVKRITYVALFFSPTSILTFVCILDKNRFTKNIPYIAWGIAGVFSLVALFTPALFFTKTVFPFQVITLLETFLALSILVHATYRRILGASFILIGGFIFSFGAVHDILATIGIIRGPELTHIGLYVYVLMQALVISFRYSKAFMDIEIATEKNKMLESLDKQKTNFFQSVSHELRTPLTLIMLPLTEVKKVLKENEYVDLAIKNSYRLFRLVNQLLDFQKVTRREHRIDLRPINLTSFLKVCSEYFIPVCQKNKVSFSVNLETTNDIVVLAQVDALEKIVFNLLSNAIKFTNRGDSIVVKLSEVEKEVEISIIDTGIGIARGDIDKLFHSFTQIERDAVTTKEGTGIGLALVKELVEKLNGSVGVSSKGENFGTTFWVRLPVAEKHRKITDLLFVDSSVNQIERYEKIVRLKSNEMSYASVESYKDALKVSKKNRFKCILLRSSNPGEVISFYEDIKEEQDFCKFILFTNLADDKLEELVKYKDKITIANPYITDDEIHLLITKNYSDVMIEDQEELDLSDFVPKKWHIQDHEVESDEKDIDSDDDDSKFNDDSDAPTVLVVDDLKDMRELIKISLEKVGYRVITASNGINALDQMKKIRPDIIVTDWMMPKMSGVELIADLKKHPVLSTIPTILLTAKSDEESRVLGSKIGASTYIGKPFDELELISAVNNLTKLKSREREIEEINKNISQKYLKRFLPPTLVEDILSGRKVFDEKPKVEYLSIVNFELAGIKDKFTAAGPQNTAKILNNYISTISSIVYKHSGCISRFEGDVIISFWGAPDEIKQSEHSKKIYACVDEIKSELSNTITDNDDIELKVAITYDLTLHGSFGTEDRSEFIVLGPNVDLTYKMLERIGDDSVIFNKGFHDLLHVCDWEKANPVEIEDLGSSKLFYKVA
jgi:signal transduction histidine kinase/CheY-like chemotaxis protein